MKTEKTLTLELFKQSRKFMTIEQYEKKHNYGINDGIFPTDKEEYTIGVICYLDGLFICINAIGQLFTIIERGIYIVGEKGITLDFLEVELYNYCINELGYQGKAVKEFSLIYRDDEGKELKTEKLYFSDFFSLFNYLQDNQPMLELLDEIKTKEVNYNN